MAQVVAACFDDVKDVFDCRTRMGGRTEPVTRCCTQLRDEKFVRSDVNVQPVTPSVALGELESVEMADNKLYSTRFIVLKLNDFLLAFLYTFVRTCFADVVML